MGLDITYYRQLAPAVKVEMDGDGNPKPYDKFFKGGSSMEWSESVWPGRAAPWRAEQIYSFSEAASFHAGSYGGYYHWRRQLAELSDDAEDFAELVNFADNEGVIGSIVSKKLAADFAKNRALAEKVDEYFFEKYKEWQKAFETAGDGGAVEFH